ncbi:MAG TPA: glycoside hydrolase family 2 TIM barrel-domain containing protein [Rectinemataceae bacterium]|nr:glycoside hydrolase family 2 TIM barrel-domain containing protein [Rectinemataceae bacterium]
MRHVRKLTEGWRFARGSDPDWLSRDFEAGGWEAAMVPATNLELPANSFDETSYQFISTWIVDLDIPDLGGGRRAFLDFEAVMSTAEVYLNGQRAGSHAGGFTPFSLEISALAIAGRNRLAVVVDSRELAELPPFGHVVDYLCYGGIYREVYLRVQEAVFIRSLVARTFDALASEKSLVIEANIDGRATDRDRRASIGGADGLVLVAEVRAFEAATKGKADDGLAAGLGGGPVLATARGRLPNGSSSLSLSLRKIASLEIWSLERPALYELTLSLEEGGRTIDAIGERIGWRSAEWRAEGFFLNGRLLKIRGLNRHQSFPYVGFAMPERAQRRDAEILKRELGVNLVRTSHYPQSRFFLDACDELGLLVFEELPGWQHIGGDRWREQALADLRAMIERDRDRPSVVLWGVRINESADSHDFYLRTNALARELDPTRARGGVRCIEKSELLEDVYTYNDFAHSGGPIALKKPRAVTGLRRNPPYLVTEHNGHMFPTKRFDNEERLAEQALRHARVLDAAYGDPAVAGAIGWCAFDYNTHKDFGSGDRVCYHGVSDMFRIPKYAAWVYASQMEPGERVVLEAASLFAKGERRAATILPVEIWTNCDEIVIYRSGVRVGSYFPDRKSFPKLPHPPVIVRDLIGDRLAEEGFSKRDQDLVREIVGIVLSKGFEALGWRNLARMGLMLARKRMSYAEAEKLISRFAMGWGEKTDTIELVGLVGGREVARRVYGGDSRAESLELRADDAELRADGIDLTRVVARLLDQYGNVQPFAIEALELSVEGPGDILGPRLLPLTGGVAAFWLRARREAGPIRVKARGSRFEAEVEVEGRAAR